MKLNGWTGGMDKIYVVYTSSGEGSCFEGNKISCAYTNYCGYHSFFTAGGQNVIYALVPYADATHCKSPPQSSPNNDVGDIAANVMAHQVVNAATNPLGNGWHDSSSHEIADICDFNFGADSWTNPANNLTANQMWNGWYFEIQTLWSNHLNACAQAGP
jgi:Phosphate-induced protein 1 conserved region